MGLRTATSLARLYQSQGRSERALGILQPFHDWFSEGFATRDLQEARRVLEKLH
jgi:predicted ATPase